MKRNEVLIHVQGNKIWYPQMSLWNMDYFMLKKVKVQKTPEETLTFPPTV